MDQLIPQEISFAELTPFLVRDVVLMGRFGRIGLVHRLGALDHRAVDQVLVLVGIKELARRPIGKLSGGQQQKVMLARALAKEPELLLLDEPFSNLDFVAREEIASTIVRLHAELALTSPIILHDLNSLPPCCDRVVLMRAGRIFRDGPPAKVLDPLTLAVLFSILVSAALGPAAERAKLEPNVIIGITFPLTMALGLIFLRFVPGRARSSSALGLLWGSILGLSRTELLELTVLAAAMAGLIALFFKEFLAILLDMKLAREAGLNPRPFYYAILFLTGMTVALSLKLIGGLLVFALMINPAATAFQLFHDMRKIIFFASLIGAGAAALGLLASFALDLPIGSSIALASTLLFASAVALSPKRRRG